MPGGKISGRQLFFLMFINLTFSGHVLLLPAALAFAGKDAWLSVLLAVPGGLAIAFCLLRLQQRFPGENLVSLCSLIAGWPGRLIALLYIGYFLFIAALTLRAIMDFMVTIFLPETPLIIVGALLILISAYTVRAGLEVLARTAESLAILAIVSGLLLSAALLPERDFKLLLPVMGNGFGPVLGGTIPALAVWSEIVVFTMFQRQLRDQTPLLRVMLLGVLLTVPSSIGTLTASVTILGLPAAAYLGYPCLSLIQMVSIGEFLERIEVYAILIWLVGSFFKVSLNYLAASLGIAQWLNLRDYQPLVLPLGTVLLPLSVLLFPSFPAYNDFMKKLYSPYSIAMGFILPLILLLMSFVLDPPQKRSKGK